MSSKIGCISEKLKYNLVFRSIYTIFAAILANVFRNLCEQMLLCGG